MLIFWSKVEFAFGEIHAQNTRVSYSFNTPIGRDESCGALCANQPLMEILRTYSQDTLGWRCLCGHVDATHTRCCLYGFRGFCYCTDCGKGSQTLEKASSVHL